MLYALIAVMVTAALAAAVLIAVDPADALAWVCRRFGFVPLTDAELAALTGLRPGASRPGTAGGRPAPAAAQAAPGAPARPVPLPQKVIERKPVPGRPPWETGTRANPIVTED